MMPRGRAIVLFLSGPTSLILAMLAPSLRKDGSEEKATKLVAMSEEEEALAAMPAQEKAAVLAASGSCRGPIASFMIALSKHPMICNFLQHKQEMTMTTQRKPDQVFLADVAHSSACNDVELIGLIAFWLWCRVVTMKIWH